MNLENFLVAVIKNTSGWVLVVIFAIYVAYHIYKKYAEGSALKQSIDILDKSIQSLLGNVDTNVRLLANRIEVFIEHLTKR